VAPTTYRFFARPPRQLRFMRGQDRDSRLRTWVAEYVRELETLARHRSHHGGFGFENHWDGHTAGAGGTIAAAGVNILVSTFVVGSCLEAGIAIGSAAAGVTAGLADDQECPKECSGD
jgi:hypothetical protein